MSTRSGKLTAGRRPSRVAVGSAALSTVLNEAVAHHQAGRLDEAAAGYRRVLASAPRHADALHLLGVIAYQKGDQVRAAKLIGRAIALDSDNAVYHNSLGSVLLASRQPDRAEVHLRRAIALKPAYAEAHNNLGNALQQSNRLTEAVDAYRQALACRSDYAEAHANLGRALQALGDSSAAVAQFRHAVVLRPGYAKAHRWLGEALGDLGQRDAAERALRTALTHAPDDADIRAALAALWERRSRLEEALAEAEGVLAKTPGHARAEVIAARCERRLGRLEAARARLERLPTAPLDADTSAFHAFELATTLDRLGAYRDAFRRYAEGNRIIMESPAGRSVDPSAFPAEIARLHDRFTEAWIAGWSPAVPHDRAHDGPPPVFLVGFPRSGTTLLDQVLNAHPALITLEEKPTIDVVKQALASRSPGYPDALAGLDAETVRDLREAYFREVARHLPDRGGRILVDKMPLDIIDAGLIHRLFPESPFILALRHPCDVVLSGFMQAFRPNPAMVHFATLEGTATLYAQVMALWQHYRALLPLQVLATRYEDLVADFTAETRRILDFLDLPWDDAVLSYRDRAKDRAIATPSYHQVVQPIYSRSVARWRNYEPELAPVIPLLRPFVEGFGYDLDDRAADGA